MKKKLLIALAIITCSIITLLPEQNIHGSTSAAPAGYTGSPFDSNGRTCGSGGGCHGGGTTNQPSIITTNIPACGYTPGQTYNITVTATSVGRTKFGFSLSAQKTSDGATVGTLIAGSGSQLNGSNRYITHTSAGTAATGSGTRVWNFQWTAPAAGTGSVSLYSAVNCTNAGGNPSGDIIFNTSVAINEGGLPPAPVISAVGSTNICAGQTVTLNTTGNGVTWSTGATTSTISVGAAGTYNTVASNACGSTQSNNISVTITNPPAAPVITAGPAGLQFCQGQSTTLTASSALPIVWTPGNFTTEQINVNTAGTYTASSTNNCGTTSSLPVAVIIDLLPVTPNITTSGNISFCIGDSVTLSTDAQFSYSWSNEITQPNITVFSSGEYFVSAANECGISYSDTIIVSADTLPATPEITFTGNGFLESSVQAPIYNWFFNGTPLNLNQSSILPSEEGAYSLTISSNSGCSSDTSEAFNYITTSIYLNSEQELKVFPNPVLQNEFITILGDVKQNIAIDIFDLQGRLVYKINAAQQVIQIPLAPGTYVLTSGTFRTKLIVNR